MDPLLPARLQISLDSRTDRTTRMTKAPAPGDYLYPWPQVTDWSKEAEEKDEKLERWKPCAVIKKEKGKA